MSRRVPDRLAGRDPKDGLVQLWRFRWGIVAFLFLAVVGLFAIVSAFEPQTLEAGQRQVRAMKADPVLAFRAPGTALRHDEEHAAERDPIGEGQSTSLVRQRFDMTGQPGDTVEAYRRAAEASGWQFVADGCSRVERATAAVFGRHLGGFDATLVVHAQLDRDPALDAHYGEPGRRGLLVSVDATQADLGDLSVDAGIHRNDVHCLRDLDLAAPDLQAPNPPSLSIGQLCSRLPLAAVKAIAPEVERAEPQTGVDQCWLVNTAGRPLFIVEHARQPKAYYDDRRLPSAQGSGNTFAFLAGGRKDPDQGPSVWVANPTGALVVAPGGVLLGSSDRDNVVLAVARSLTTAGR